MLPGPPSCPSVAPSLAPTQSNSILFFENPITDAEIDPLLLSESNGGGNDSSPSGSPPAPSPATLLHTVGASSSSVPAPSQIQVVTSRAQLTVSDPSGNSHYVSHLRPFLVDHVVVTQQCAEEKHQRDAEQVRQRKQVMECAVAFSFTAVSHLITNQLLCVRLWLMSPTIGRCQAYVCELPRLQLSIFQAH
jgi:hypothetical protein